jgi:bifunctional non-homologous end joining protein LigD
MHEVKWDGMRVLAEVRDGVLRLWSRNENDVTASFPELHDLGGFGHDVLLDGEVVAMAVSSPSPLSPTDADAEGGAGGILARQNPVTLIVFDLLRSTGDSTGSVEVRRVLDGLGIGSHQVPRYDETGVCCHRESRGRGGVSKKVVAYHFAVARRIG